jgi:hypothetical protein
MNGAAVSNLLSYALYFILIIITVRLTVQAPTFTRQHTKILFLLLLILSTNTLWLKYLPINNIWISSIIRTTVLIGGACAIAWFKNLSPEINQQVRALGKRLKA